MTKEETKKAIEAMKNKIEIQFTGFNFDIYIKDRKTGEIKDAYLDVDPDFAGVFVNELLKGFDRLDK